LGQSADEVSALVDALERKLVRDLGAATEP